MGFAAKQWSDEMVFEPLNKGFSEKYYDGPPFFSDKDTIGDTIHSNKGRQVLSSSVAETPLFYGKACKHLSQMKDEEG